MSNSDYTIANNGILKPHEKRKELLKKHLTELLVNTPKDGESESLNQKRNNEIEKVQLEFDTIVLGELNCEYNNMGVYIDLDVIKNSKKEKNQWIITNKGKIIPRASEERNEWYDSKSFDGIVPITINGKEYLLILILKGVQYPGGHQDDAKKEIGVYTKQIQKNTNENYHFIFQLDGTYINKGVEKLDVSEKYDITTTATIKETIEKFINKNL